MSKTINMDAFLDTVLEEKSIDFKKVVEAAKNAAEDIHGKPDMNIIRSIADKAVKAGKDTEDAIQIAVNMLRSKK